MSKSDDNTPIVPSNAPPRPDNPILLEYAWKPMWIEDSNSVWVVVGDPGDGKSLASLRIAETIYPDFNVDMVASNIVEFMELVMDDSLGQGTPIVLEEASVEASSYDWYSESNAVFRTVLETWRTQNRMAIINLPNFKSLDKGARRRTQMIVEMQEAKPWKDYSVAKPKLVNYNNIDDHFTTPFPVLGGKKHQRLRFSLPSEELRVGYEELKREYQGELNRDLHERLLEKVEEKEESNRNMNPKNIATKIKSDYDIKDFLSFHGAHKKYYIDKELIELEFDITDRNASKVKKLLQRDDAVVFEEKPDDEKPEATA